MIQSIDGCATGRDGVGRVDVFGRHALHRPVSHADAQPAFRSFVVEVAVAFGGQWGRFCDLGKYPKWLAGQMKKAPQVVDLRGF